MAIQARRPEWLAFFSVWGGSQLLLEWHRPSLVHTSPHPNLGTLATTLRSYLMNVFRGHGFSRAPEGLIPSGLQPLR